MATLVHKLAHVARNAIVAHVMRASLFQTYPILRTRPLSMATTSANVLVCIVLGLLYRKLQLWRKNFKAAKTAKFPTYYSPQVASKTYRLPLCLTKPSVSTFKTCGGSLSSPLWVRASSYFRKVGRDHGCREQITLPHNAMLTSIVLQEYGGCGMWGTNHFATLEATRLS
jgi:hypothetical protein